MKSKRNLPERFRLQLSWDREEPAPFEREKLSPDSLKIPRSLDEYCEFLDEFPPRSEEILEVKIYKESFRLHLKRINIKGGFDA
jgi:hypothetical protein